MEVKVLCGLCGSGRFQVLFESVRGLRRGGWRQEVRLKEEAGALLARREGPQEGILVPWEQHMAGSLGGQSPGQPRISCVTLEWLHLLSGLQYLLA